MVVTVDGKTEVLVSLDKWKRVKATFQKNRREILQKEWLNHKQLERGQGFLIYLSRDFNTKQVKIINV